MRSPMGSLMVNALIRIISLLSGVYAAFLDEYALASTLFLLVVLDLLYEEREIRKKGGAL